MSDLIRLTEKEHKWLIGILPDNIGSVQLYQQPALEEYCVEYLYESNGRANFTYRRVSETLIQKFDGVIEEAPALDMSTVIACTVDRFAPGFDTSKKDHLLFGYTMQKEFCMIAPKTDFWNDLEKFGWLQWSTVGLVRLYETIQYLLLHHKELLQFSVTKEPSKHSGKKKGGKTKKSSSKKTRLYRLVHMTDDQAEELKKTIAAECEKRKRERLCSAWGVRGHYRHYKSGKVAYIKPHVRGKEKEKYTGREYALFPKM